MMDTAMTDAMPESLSPTMADGPAPVAFLEELADIDAPAAPGEAGLEDLHAVLDVPVRVQAVLGRSKMPIGELLRLKVGMVIELDRRVGEPVDIFVNDRLIARGEVVLIDNMLGITLTEILKQER